MVEEELVNEGAVMAMAMGDDDAQVVMAYAEDERRGSNDGD